MLTYRFRPLVSWTGPSTPADLRRPRSTFRAGWEDTLDILIDELEHLMASDVVIQADFREADLRLDGMPRGNARLPQHPGVRVAFDSRHGPLTYATDTHVFWQHNVRAIALGLRALRAVDRYGVTRRGEQYKGWRQLEAGPAGAPATVQEAAEFIIVQSGRPMGDVALGARQVLAAPDAKQLLAKYYREALKRLHPDHGGAGDEDFARLIAAKTLIDKAGLA